MAHLILDLVLLNVVVVLLFDLSIRLDFLSVITIGTSLSLLLVLLSLLLIVVFIVIVHAVRVELLHHGVIEGELLPSSNQVASESH